jgi:hypothetical protein
LEAILEDVTIRKIGFGVFGDQQRLASMKVSVTSVCDMANMALMAWPQTEKSNPKSGKWYVKSQLNSPCPLYTEDADKPVKDGVHVRCWKMDFAKTVDEWRGTWSWYNAMDHYLAYALLDHLSARAAELDGLDSNADVVRYQLDLLDAIRNLPDVGIIRRAKGFARNKDGSDPMKKMMRPWPLLVDYSIYVRFRQRREYKLSIPRRHKLDMSHFNPKYVLCLEAQLGTNIMEWDRSHRTDHGSIFIMVGVTFPHACGSCGGFDHDRKDCPEEKTCIFPACKEEGHDIMVCPLITHRCVECGDLGHRNHNKYTIPILAEQFKAARHVHLVACRMNNRRLAYKVVKEPESMMMEVEEVESPYSASLRQ